MAKTLRYLHFIGLALLLGSVPTHILLGRFGPDGPIPPQGVLFARIVIEKITLFVTLPGCLLAVASGLAMLLLTRRPLAQTRWLAAHLGLGLLIAANGLFVLTPDVLTLTELARAATEGEWPLEAWAAAKRREDVAGTVNLVLILGTMLVAVARPRLTRRPVLAS